MPKLYDQQGKPVQVKDGAEAQAGILSGKYLPKKDIGINVVDEGQVVSVHPKDLTQALASGMRIASDHEAKQAYIENKLGPIGKAVGTLDKLMAWNTGGLRGATLGFSDKIAVEMGDFLGGKEGKKLVQDNLKDIKESHPILSSAGEITGAIASAFIPGGEGAAVGKVAQGAKLATEGAEALKLARGAEALGGAIKGEKALATGVKTAESLFPKALTPTGLVDIAGGKLEAELASKLGYSQEANALSRIGIKGITSAARGAFEGAAMGAGDAISEDALGDHELTAERLLSHMGHGALFGGLVGGPIGGGVEALSTALRKASPTLQKASDELLVRSLDPKGKMNRSIQKTIEDIGQDKFAKYVREFNLPPGKMDSDGVRVALEKVAGDLEGVGQQYYKQVDNVAEWGAKQNRQIVDTMFDELKHGYTDPEGQKILGLLSSPKTNAGAVRTVFNQLTDALGVDMGRKIQLAGKKAARETEEVSSLIGKAQAAIEKSGGQLTADELALLAQRSQKAKPKTRTLGSMFEEYLGKGKYQDAFDLLGKEVEKGNYQLKTAEEAAQRVREIQQRSKVMNSFVPGLPGSAGPAPDVQGLRGLYTKIRNVVDDHIASNLGKEAETGLKEWRQKYRVFKRVEELAEHAQLRGRANNILGLSDTVVGAGALAGSLATGHPLAAVIAPFASKWIRDNGASYGARILDKAANLGAIKKLADKSDAALEKGTKEFFKPKAKPKFHTYGSGKSLDEHFKNEAERVQFVAQNPDISMQQIANNIQPLAGHAPNTALYAQQAAVATALKLQKLLPKPPGQNIIFDQSTTPDPKRISDLDKMRWLKQVEAATQPYQTVAKGLARGTITPEQVDIIKQTNKKAYDDIANKFAIKLAQQVSKGDVMPYNKKVVVGTLFNIPVDHSMDHNFVLAMQSNFISKSETSGAAGRRKAKRGAGLGVSNISGNMELESIRLEGGKRGRR